MWTKIKTFFSSAAHSVPQIMGGLVAAGEAAKLAQEALETGGIPTDYHDWIMFWGGVGLAFAKQWNQTHAKIPNAVAAPAPPKPVVDPVLPKVTLP